MRNIAVGILLLVVPCGLLLPPRSARADVAPAPCSREAEERRTDYCAQYKISLVDVWGCSQDKVNTPANPALCKQSTEEAKRSCCNGWLAGGWQHRCRDLDANVVVWCRPRMAGDPPPPTVQKGCALSAGGRLGGGAFGLLALAGSVLAVRRRRR